MNSQTTVNRARALYDRYTRDLSSEDLQRLFTHDTWDAYRFFTRGLDEEAVEPAAVVAALGHPGAPDLHRVHAEAAAGTARALPDGAGGRAVSG